MDLLISILALSLIADLDLYEFITSRGPSLTIDLCFSWNLARLVSLLIDGSRVGNGAILSLIGDDLYLSIDPYLFLSALIAFSISLIVCILSL